MRPRCAGLALLAMLLLAGCGGGGGHSGGAHSFLGKASDLVLYVELDRSGDNLTGTLTQATLNSGRSAVATSRSPFTGTAHGSAVSLQTQPTDGNNATLTGTLGDGSLSLEYLRPSDGIVTVQLQQSDTESFNVALASLRDRVDQTTAAATAAPSADTTEQDRVTRDAQAVQDDIAALSAATAAAPSTKGHSDAAVIDELRGELQTVRRDARAALNASTLRACSTAATVQADLNTLEAHAANVTARQTTRDTGTSAVSKAIAKLHDDFVTLQGDDDRYLPSDTPTQRIVGRAIKLARRKLPKHSSPSSDTATVVEGIVEQARGLQGSAGSRCRAGGA